MYQLPSQQLLCHDASILGIPAAFYDKGHCPISILMNSGSQTRLKTREQTRYYRAWLALGVRRRSQINGVEEIRAFGINSSRGILRETYALIILAR